MTIEQEIEQLEMRIAMIEDMPEQFQTEDIWDEYNELISRYEELIDQKHPKE